MKKKSLFPPLLRWRCPSRHYLQWLQRISIHLTKPRRQRQPIAQ